MEIIFDPDIVCVVVIVLEDNEIDKMLTYVDIVLTEKCIKEKSLDFLYKSKELKKYYLAFKLIHKELLIRVLQLAMRDYGTKLRFAEEEKMYSAIVRLQADFKQRQPH